MAHPNEDLMRKGYAAFAEGDMATVGELFADDIVWHFGGDNILAGDYEGKEAVFGMFGRLMQETAGTFKNDIHDILANDEHAVALATISATRNGKTMEERSAQIYHVADGKVTEFWAFNENQDVIDDFYS